MSAFSMSVSKKERSLKKNRATADLSKEFSIRQADGLFSNQRFSVIA